jgi:glycosyltransferase involved in cell wall biosynthesis
MNLSGKRYRLLFDARMIDYSGIGRYIENLLRNYNQMDMSPWELILAGNPERLKDFTKGINIMIRSFSAKPYFPGELIEWQRLLNELKPDLVHVPHYNAPIFPNTKLIVNIHDLLHWKNPETVRNPLGRYYSKARFTRTLHKADLLLTLTQTIKEELTVEFPDTKDKIEVIYPGVPSFSSRSSLLQDSDNVLQKYNITKAYFLFVGIDKPHKNLSLLIRAFEKANSILNNQIQLVVTGNHQRITHEGLSGQSLVRTGRINDSELTIIYEKALALVSPSLSEGFGFTPFEGFAHGIPSLVSDIPVNHEVCEDSVLYFNPQDGDDMASAMVQLYNDKELRKSFIIKGQKQLNRFNWQKTAVQTLAQYNRFISPHQL